MVNDFNKKKKDSKSIYAFGLPILKQEQLSFA